MDVPQRTEPGRLLRAALALSLAIVILVLVTLNYMRVTRIDYSPTEGVTELYRRPTATATLDGAGLPASTSTIIAAPTPTAGSLAATPTPPGRPPSTLAERTLQTLQQAEVPARDLYSIAARLRLKTSEPIPRTTDRPAGNYALGHSDVFYIADLPAKRYFTITATIREVTEHAYWYAQDGRSTDLNAIKRAARTFESAIYPTNRRLFGEEWTPGVDNDPRITVLFAGVPGAGGYFSSADEHTRFINPVSNEREMIYINTDSGWGNLESTLAHEFQHMIHWHQRPNHDVWLNEGASMMAQAINGYTLGGVDEDFMRTTDTQLNAWAPTPDVARPNYGAAFLFLALLRNNYGGDDAIRAVVSAPGEGIDAVDKALRSLGRQERFTDVFQRWALTNLLDGMPGAQSAGYEYPERVVSVSPAERVTSYPARRLDSVAQFGVDYIQLDRPSDRTPLRIDFSGQSEVPVLATQAHSGSSFYWSNRGDMANTTLTRKFDLRTLASATLDFYIWLDTESDLDYGYVEASTDGGATWDTLEGLYTTSTNPNGTNFGYGYTGASANVPGADPSGWLHERIALDKYTGQEVLVRFEYITDDGYNMAGIAVDDISIPELGWSDDAEGAVDGDAGSWQGDGWVRIANALPQSYFLALVMYAEDGSFSVEPVEVSPGGKASIALEGDYSSAVLLVAATTPYTLQRAEYTLGIE